MRSRKRGRIEEPAVRPEVEGEVVVASPRNVSRHAVDGLGLAPVAGGLAAVHETPRPQYTSSMVDDPLASGLTFGSVRAGRASSPPLVAPPAASHAGQPPSSTAALVWPM